MKAAKYCFFRFLHFHNARSTVQFFCMSINIFAVGHRFISGKLLRYFCSSIRNHGFPIMFDRKNVLRYSKRFFRSNTIEDIDIPIIFSTRSVSFGLFGLLCNFSISPFVIVSVWDPLPILFLITHLGNRDVPCRWILSKQIERMVQRHF